MMKNITQIKTYTETFFGPGFYNDTELYGLIEINAKRPHFILGLSIAYFTREDDFLHPDYINGFDKHAFLPIHSAEFNRLVSIADMKINFHEMALCDLHLAKLTVNNLDWSQARDPDNYKIEFKRPETLVNGVKWQSMFHSIVTIEQMGTISPSNTM